MSRDETESPNVDPEKVDRIVIFSKKVMTYVSSLTDLLGK